MSEQQKYGRMAVVDGGQFGRKSMRPRTAKEIELDDRMRAAFERCRGRDGLVPSRAVQEIREGRQAPWRKNAVRVLEMVQEGVPTPDIKAAIVGEMEQWIDEVAARPDKAA